MRTRPHSSVGMLDSIPVFMYFMTYTLRVVSGREDISCGGEKSIISEGNSHVLVLIIWLSS